MTVDSEKADFIPLFAKYQADAVGSPVSAWWAPPNSRPQIMEVDITPFFDPYTYIPRLYELREWFTRPNAALMYFLFWKDNVVRNLTKQLTTMIVGDGFRVKILNREENEFGEREERQDITKSINNWLGRIGGKGRSVNNYVIPWVMIDNIATGGSSFYKYIGEEGDDDDEIGELMLKHLDPRSYVVVHQDFRDWRKLVQFPIVQHGVTENMTRAQFNNWKPSLQWSYIHRFSSAGYTKQLPPRDIPWNKQYYFDLFFRAPMNTIIEDIISKMQAKFFHIKGLEKVSFPFMLIKVPRHSVRDNDDAKYKTKLDDAAQIGAEIRSGDSFAFPGIEYTDDGTKLTEGWQVEVIDTASKLKDFQVDIRMLNEEIAIGLFLNIAMVSASGVMGQQTHQATGANLMSITQMLGKTLRAEIQAMLFQVIKDYVLLKFNEKLEDEDIEEQWSKLREADVAAFFQIIIQSYSQQLVSLNEARSLMERIGIDLDPLDEEELARQQALMGGEGEGEQPFDRNKLPQLPEKAQAKEPQDREERKG